MDLEKLGIPPAEAAAIADDLKRLDARSLLRELLMAGLWSNVIDETDATQLSRMGSNSLERLLASGADPDDLTDVIRETQINTIHSVAQLIDWPTECADLDEILEMEISVRFPGLDGPAMPIHRLHSCLMERDPSGRQGEPRSQEMRQRQKLPEQARDQLDELVRNRQLSAAALLWKLHVGGDLKTCLAAVQSLSQQRY